MTTLRIAITPGEPAGIGPDIVIKQAQLDNKHELVVVADPQLLVQRAQLLGLPLRLRDVQFDQAAQACKKGELAVYPVTMHAESEPGKLNAANSPYVLETLKTCVKHCLRGDYAALVTAPVQKSIINDAGISFTGHTEFLAELCQCNVVMMLASEDLRVALATTHLPLRAVAEAINKPLLRSIITILHQDLVVKFGIKSPRILVAGLNPHAGEGGHLGLEEQTIISPVLESFRNQGMDLIGPLPADTLFTRKYLDQADAVLAMYHDQGLPVLKSQSFGSAINITLGLPFIRTSVDHGTALDLAGSGTCNAGSLQLAIDHAIKLADSFKKRGRYES